MKVFFKSIISTYILLLGLLLGSLQTFATVRYVKPAATGTGTSLSWTNASSDLQAMINASSNGDEIWVMENTHYPNRHADATGTITTGDRRNAYVMKTGVSIYGGFAGSESSRLSRNYTTNVTTLSGDIGTAITATDNCYHVVVSISSTGGGLLDGFTVTNGYADNGSSLTINGLSVRGDRAGGIYIHGATTQIKNCKITRNTALNGAGAGGIFSSSASTTTITSCSFQQNTTSSTAAPGTCYGGAIFLGSPTTTISTYTFTSNTTNAKNGAIYVNTTKATDISDCTFTTNSANNGGGIALNTTDDVSLMGCAFTSNTASTYGGGIFDSATATVITGCTFTSNSAPNGGGLLNYNASPTISDCDFTSNTGTYGAGLYNLTSSPAISQCNFLSNTATQGGGAMRNYSASPTIRNCVFSGNAASLYGGGFYNSISAMPQIINCLISGNTATNGGGIASDNSSTVSVKNTTIAANKVTTSGGGIYSNGSAFTLYNTIIWGNKIGTSTVSYITTTGAGTYTVNYCLLEGTFSGATNTLTSDPLFTSQQTAGLNTGGDYRLQKCSPAINTGSNSLIPSGITTDLSDTTRTIYTTVDIGAYEYCSFVSSVNPDANGIVYVDATKSGNGNSWNNAVSELSDALLAAKYNTAIKEIWVAKATYKPIYNSNDASNQFCSGYSRNNAFVLVNDVKVYGGFAGGETNVSQRNATTNTTILSGDIGTVGSSTDNCYHVVISAGSVGTALLDGFTITKGVGASVGGSISVNSISTDNYRGGGIFTVYSSPQILNCTITDNMSYSGGGLATFVASPIITNCSFSSNTAYYSGGGIDNFSGSNSVITSCSFFNNTSQDHGGGIVISAGSTPVVTACVFSGNTTTYDGGGIYLISNSGTIKIYNCRISGNTSTLTGAGVYIYSSLTDIVNCTIVGNRAIAGNVLDNKGSTTTIKNSIVWNNSASGSVLYNESGSTLTISNSDVQGGYAGTANINTDPLFVSPKLASDAPTTNGDYSLQRCSPALDIGNNSAIAGYAFDLDSNTRTINATVDMGAYEKQYALPDANGIVYVDATKSGTGKTWASAVAEVADALKAAKYNSSITQIWVKKGTYYPLYDAATLGCSPTDSRDKSFVLVNNVKLFGGFAGGETDTANRNFTTNETILSGDFNNNDVIAGSGSTLSITNNAENAYHVVISAGAVGTAGLDGFTLQKGNANGPFTNITVNTKLIHNNAGGGMYNISSSPTVTNCSFTGNSASSCGGMYNNFSSSTVSNCSFINNLVSFSGGGMNNISSSPTVSNCSFIGNSASSGGGGMYNYSSSAIVSDCSFTGNSAATSLGGAMHIASSSPTVSNCSFTGNLAYSGGGIYNEASSATVISNCSFTSNSASSQGGAMYTYSSSSIVNNCSFTGNSASSQGGGIYNTGSSPTVSNCNFTGNSAATGGGIFNNTSSPTIVNNKMMDNSADFGGAMLNYFSSPTIVNSIITGNLASFFGGGMYNSNASSPTITNCTIAANKAASSGGGIYTSSGTPVIKNSIIWSNRSGATAATVSNITGTATITYSAIEGGYTGTGNINIDPLFVNPQLASAAPTTAGDYRLQSCSPAINLGDNSSIPGGITTDLDNNIRIKFTTVDLGAYEIQTQDLTQSTWKGVNTNWNDVINWCGGYIPTSSTNVTVPTGLSNYPVIGASATNDVKNLSLANATSIGTNATGKLTIYGTYSNSGSTITNNGSWVMAGSSTGQTFPGTSATVSAMNNLEINNANGVALDKSFEITGTLTPTNGAINVGNNVTITLNSDATSTARVAEVKGGASFSYTGTGKFAVERYFPAQRSWRLLTSPLTSTPTIYDSWQNSGLFTSGIGMLVTGPSPSGSNGLDVSAQNNYSMYTWNMATQKYTGVTSTKPNTLSANLATSADNTGYLTFVRGDRTLTNTSIPNTNNTTLTSTGRLQTGTQLFSANSTAGKLTLIGNPYVSPVNFDLVTRTNLVKRMYVLDPSLGSVGAMVMLDDLNNDNVYNKTFSSSPQDNHIQSSQAFYVETLAAGAASLQFDETNKSTGNNLLMFRPSGVHNGEIRTTLSIVNPDNSLKIADETFVEFDDDYSAEVNYQDAAKLTNVGEMFSMFRNDVVLCAERRPGITVMDTLFYRLSKSSQKKYRLSIKTTNLPNTGLDGYLEDSYLKTSTLVNLHGITDIDFIINGDAASAAIDRFMLVFKPSAGPLPVKFVDVSAFMQNDNANIKWSIENETNILKYEIERSVNGQNFESIGTLSASSGNGSKDYFFIDKGLNVSSDYYYRVKSISINGEVRYSSIVKLYSGRLLHQISVYPNPVTNGVIGLQLTGMDEGKYIVNLIDNAGRKLMNSTFRHDGIATNHPIAINNTVSMGEYILNVVNPEGSSYQTKILIR